MYSFEDLQLAGELVEALTSEGLEQPTEFQRAAIPVMRRGNNLLGAAGPGAGTLVAYGTVCLEKIDPSSGLPGALILTATAAAATELAESLGRIALSTGHSVSALGGAWAEPERSDVLFGTAQTIREAVDASRLSLLGVRSVIVDNASTIEAAGGLDEVSSLLEYVSPDVQRIILSLPVTDTVQAFVATHAPKAVQVPPGVAPTLDRSKRTRGCLHFRITEEDKAAALLDLVSELIRGGARQIVLFCRSEDWAADVGDFLTLHGFPAGAPGDDAFQIWLAVEPLATREALRSLSDQSDIRTVSVDCPPDIDTLDRRHGFGDRAIVLLFPREIPHFRDTARRAGYEVRPLPPKPSPLEGHIAQIRTDLANAASRMDLAPYYLLLEPLLERFSPQELATAAVALLSGGVSPEETARTEPAPGLQRTTDLPEWTRLFVSIGEMEGVTPGSLLGTLAGESGVDGACFGKIEIRDTYSLVEVTPPMAEKVIKAVNGVSIRGRSTRVDYDRGGKGRGSGNAGKGVRGKRGGRGPTSGQKK